MFNYGIMVHLYIVLLIFFQLDVSENRISNSLQNLSGCIELKSLNLSQNKLKSFEAIEPLVHIISSKLFPLYFVIFYILLFSFFRNH